MANGWKGIIWERLEKQSAGKKYSKRQEPVPNWMNNRPGETELERLKRITADITGVPETAGNNPEIAARAEALKQQLAK
jgi:hypothetical protein